MAITLIWTKQQKSPKFRAKHGKKRGKKGGKKKLDKKPPAVVKWKATKQTKNTRKEAIVVSR